MRAEAADFIIISEHPIGLVRRNPRNGQNGFFANQAFGRGDVISALGAASVVATPNYLTVQIGESRHIHLDPEYLKNINHSCDPNVFFDTAAMEVVALQDIPAGEELRFFYPSSEWKMDQPFSCHCGFEKCLGEIKGAAETDRAVLARYRLTDFIRGQLAADDSGV